MCWRPPGADRLSFRGPKVNSRIWLRAVDDSTINIVLRVYYCYLYVRFCIYEKIRKSVSWRTVFGRCIFLKLSAARPRDAASPAPAVWHRGIRTARGQPPALFTRWRLLADAEPTPADLSASTAHQSRQWVDGHRSRGQMGHFFGWGTPRRDRDNDNGKLWKHWFVWLSLEVHRAWGETAVSLRLRFFFRAE